MENLNIALTLLGVGMGTVFFILLFIIVFSRYLLITINKYVPAEEVETKKHSRPSTSNNATSPKVVAAISAAVNIASKGAMKVSKIEKI